MAQASRGAKMQIYKRLGVSITPKKTPVRGMKSKAAKGGTKSKGVKCKSCGK